MSLLLLCTVFLKSLCKVLLQTDSSRVDSIAGFEFFPGSDFSVAVVLSFYKYCILVTSQLKNIFEMVNTPVSDN